MAITRSWIKWWNMMEHEGISQLAARNHPFLVEFSIATPDYRSVYENDETWRNKHFNHVLNFLKKWRMMKHDEKNNGQWCIITLVLNVLRMLRESILKDTIFF